MERYIIKANKIIARDQLEVMENSGLLIENGKIQKIYDNISQVEIPEQTNVIDYGDKVIIPGMIDCHNHLALSLIHIWYWPFPLPCSSSGNVRRTWDSYPTAARMPPYRMPPPNVFPKRQTLYFRSA